MMRKRSGLALLLVVLLAPACAPTIVPAPPLTLSPRFPDFVPPDVPPSFAGTGAAVAHDRGWRFLQAGDLRNAARELDLAVRAAPDFYPGEAALGYLELARKNQDAALGYFDRALERQQDYVPALAGRGQALVALDREPEALAAFEAALAAAPGLADIRRRVEVLRFRAVERNLADARRAARAGRADEAVQAYLAAIASSPDSAFLYRELAAVERQRGDVDRALEHFRRAAELDPSDASLHAQIGALLEARGDFDGALVAYDHALSIEPSEVVDAMRAALLARAELARLPEQYRAIETAPYVTRADLAALIGVRLGPVLQAAPSQSAVVLTDVRANWAASWIMAVARAGVMDPFDNHTFQPSAIVRRVDLAEAISRLLPAVAAPAQARAWQTARGRFPDVSPGHLAYPDASAAVASGVMITEPDGTFQPSRPVTGAEAVEAIARLQQMANLPAQGSGRR